MVYAGMPTKYSNTYYRQNGNKGDLELLHYGLYDPTQKKRAVHLHLHHLSPKAGGPGKR